MKTSAKTAIFVLFATAMGFSETPKQVGAWSIYTSNHNQAVMLQSTSESSQLSGADGKPVAAKLDVICQKGKVAAIALEPSFSLQKSVISFTSFAPTTRVLFISDGEKIPSEQWQVLDGGRTLAPRSEVMQARLMHRWVERIASLKHLGVQLSGNAAEQNPQPSFATNDLSEALSSVGCSY